MAAVWISLEVLETTSSLVEKRGLSNIKDKRILLWAAITCVAVLSATAYMGGTWFFALDPFYSRYMMTFGDMSPIGIPPLIWLGGVLACLVCAFSTDFRTGKLLAIGLLFVLALSCGRNWDIATVAILGVLAASPAPRWSYAAGIFAVCAATVFAFGAKSYGHYWYPAQSVRSCANVLAAQETTPRILSTGDDSVPLAYFCRGETVGSFFWEGYHSTPLMHQMLAAKGDEAHKFLKEAGVTHLVLPLGQKVNLSGGDAAGSILAMGETDKFPSWLEYIGDFGDCPDMFRAWKVR